MKKLLLVLSDTNIGASCVNGMKQKLKKYKSEI